MDKVKLGAQNVQYRYQTHEHLCTNIIYTADVLKTQLQVSNHNNNNSQSSENQLKLENAQLNTRL